MKSLREAFLKAALPPSQHLTGKTADRRDQRRFTARPGPARRLDRPPPPSVKKSAAEWVWLLLGIDVNCCPRCGEKTLQRTILLPVHLPRPVTAVASTQRPALEDTS